MPTYWLETLSADVRYALRTLRRSPGYAAAAILALALGIGANTAIFSVIDEILLRPPDVPEPAELAQVYNFNRKTSAYVSSSYADYLDLSRAHSFRHLSAYARFPLNVRLRGETAERISVEAVTGNYFDMLRVPPLAGRPLAPADDRPGAEPVAMIAEELWRDRFHADPAIIGQTVLIEDQPLRIVGVAPHRVSGLNLNWATPPRIWIPLRAAGTVVPRLGAIKIFDNRAMIWLVVTGRLQPGVSVESSQAELQTIAARTNRDLTVAVFPLSRSKFWPAYRSDIRRSLSGFGIGAGLILLLACANVSNLLLGRAIGRRPEIAVRLAVGAGRGRLVRQLLTESAVLAVLSCASALLVAQAVMQLLSNFPTALSLPLFLELHLEPRAMAMCAALSVLTVALFGAAPALRAARLDILPALRRSGNATGRRSDWMRTSLVAVQAALSMILLAGGGVYGHTLWKAYAVDLGFESSRLLIASFSLSAPGAEGAERAWNAQQQLLDRLSTTPGITAASLSSNAILSTPRGKLGIRAADSATPLSAASESVSRGFFATLGIPILAGRDFLPSDSAGVVVNQTLAASLPRGALGQSISLQSPGRPDRPVTVVGIARDARYGSVWDRPEPHIYLLAQPGDPPAGQLAVRTSAPPATLAAEIRRLWATIAPVTPLYDLQTGHERVNLMLTPQRVAGGILGGFGALALILTALGLYSVVSFSVAQQKREIGIRMAIGARPGAIFRAVLRRAIAPAFAGLILGAVASLPLMRFLAAGAKQVSPYDGPAFLIAALLLAAVATIAAWIPARRALHVDPSAALRAD